MRRMLLVLSLLLVCTMVVAENSMAADKQPVFGKTYNEIVALAKKEGTVRLASAMTSGPESQAMAARIVKPFVDKYGIKVDYTLIHGVEARERILLELMGGVCNYDLLHNAAVLIPQYIKAGQIAGPFDWQGLFGKEFKIEPRFISPDKRMISCGAISFWFYI